MNEERQNRMDFSSPMNSNGVEDQIESDIQIIQTKTRKSESKKKQAKQKQMKNNFTDTREEQLESDMHDAGVNFSPILNENNESSQLRTIDDSKEKTNIKEQVGSHNAIQEAVANQNRPS